MFQLLEDEKAEKKKRQKQAVQLNPVTEKNKPLNKNSIFIC